MVRLLCQNGQLLAGKLSALHSYLKLGKTLEYVHVYIATKLYAIVTTEQANILKHMLP